MFAAQGRAATLSQSVSAFVKRQPESWVHDVFDVDS